MRDLTDYEASVISGADAGSTFVGNVGSSLGGALGAAVGSRIGIGAVGGAAIGSGVGAVAGEAAYNKVRNAAKAWNPAPFGGTSFFPQTGGA